VLRQACQYLCDCLEKNTTIAKFAFSFTHKQYQDLCTRVLDRNARLVREKRLKQTQATPGAIKLNALAQRVQQLSDNELEPAGPDFKGVDPALIFVLDPDVLLPLYKSGTTAQQLAVPQSTTLRLCCPVLCMCGVAHPVLIFYFAARSARLQPHSA
jgi:hypothetical protein